MPQSSWRSLLQPLYFLRLESLAVGFQAVAGRSRVSGLCGGVQVAEQDVWE
jgi:hypothetical protein